MTAGESPPGPSPELARESDEFRGRVALVTGAAGGIGAAVARTLAGYGAAVSLADRDRAGLGDLAAELARQRRATLACRLDVRDARAVEETVARTEQELGPVDILANCAGVLCTGPVVETGEEDWEYVLAVNATGVFHTSRAVARRMVCRRRGAIVTVASNAAGVPRAGMAAYAASKAAAAHFTRCLGLELAPYGIRCNVVAPGSTDTPMQRALWDETTREAPVVDGDLTTYRTGIPLRRIATPQDIADAVVFLASDRARHITMHDLYVDGGATLRA
ncbi:2,3-dihydro-2,3-dihydroxybenzoate dehydrogenase [Streptomyces prunicolor]|uniref:2,3-dihydro-2,3-dihydroxybenzoate dehydrogenase n=1 Tax=Streptomyces prunicolor TaxID=67348 RepID=UPI00371237D1